MSFPWSIGLDMAIKPLLLGTCFICVLLAIILLIPAVSGGAPNVATNRRLTDAIPAAHKLAAKPSIRIAVVWDIPNARTHFGIFAVRTF
ncbi:exported hypothetical protein [Rhizobium mesoamericanum STM3625]|uniref:Uncharacterized protein n=1 Tax=Rhizobium mesoamericanum STM3625 TaxID=1211777 RepID=K0PG22_9HYPH|nr:exported hypothetical protein [Rhizobium mesoamericanum STM3625]